MTAKQIAKSKELERIKKVYLMPASKELKKAIKLGILPENCMILWANNSTIEMIENAKKI